MNRTWSAVLAGCLCAVGCGAELTDEDLSRAKESATNRREEMLAPLSAMSLRRELPQPPDAYPGLRIEIEDEGEGEAIHYGMVGRFHYIGTLANGKVFHSTYAGDEAEPELLRMLPPQVPEGFAIGMDGCKVGGRRSIKVPSELGFGASPHHEGGVTVPPNALLIYEAELVDVVHGLQIAVLKEGTGPELEYGQQATVHYTGVLAKDGTVFDTTEFGQPSPFRILKGPGQVIAGWWLGLPGMKVGEKRRLRVPSELAYGKEGNGKIPADADLIFDVELVGIQ